MKKSRVLKLLTASIVILIFFTAFKLGLKDLLTLEQLKVHQDEFVSLVQEHPFSSASLYFLFYVAVTAFSFPGATILTLAAGAIFGLMWGVVLVSFASTTGATLAFLVGRTLFRDSIQNRFPQKMKEIDAGFARDGAFYLFTLRLLPIFPFFLVNLLMSVVPMSVTRFFLVSQIGMLPATVIYVNAGKKISEISSPAQILTIDLILSFALIGILPWLAKGFVAVLRNQRIYRRFSKPKSFDYNLVVIGAGAAGLVSSFIAATVRAKVALIESRKMGGDCLNTGCVPSKALIRSARAIWDLKRAHEFGLSPTPPEADFSQIISRVHEKIRKIEPHDSVERYSKMGVDCLHGQARIKTPFEVEIDGRTVTTRSIVIASGAEPVVPNLPGLEQTGFRTAESLWDLSALPKRLLILGGGPIGCELAQAFQRIGSQVLLIELSPQLLVREDQEVSRELQKVFAREGIELFLGCQAFKFEKVNDRKTVFYRQNGEEKSLQFDEVVLALGRKARTKGFGLEELGVEIAPNGTIQADEYLRTNFPNIFVAGDCVGPFQFTHVAAHQAWFSSVNALFGRFKKFKVDYRVIPAATYVDPEIARVGLNETEARAQSVPYEVYRFEMSELDRAIVESEEQGFIKVLVRPKSDQILGVTIVSAHAAELLAEFTLAMKHGLGLNKILATVHPYPTFSEANKYTAGVWKKANAPEGVLKMTKKYFDFARRS